MPNAKVLESKKAVVEALSGKIKEATSVVFVDYKGILSNSDTLVVNENHGSSILDLGGQGIDNSLLALKNLCVGHNFHLRK